MAFSAFDDKGHEPGDQEVAEVVAGTAKLWSDLRTEIAARHDPLSEDWVFSGRKWGWALRLKHKKRAVLYMTPVKGFFYVGFALGQKAVDAAHESDLPQSILDLIDGSQKFAEGRGVRIEVRSAEDLRTVVGVATIKMAN